MATAPIRKIRQQPTRLDELLSGKKPRRPKSIGRGRKKKKPPEPLPQELQPLSDAMAAGKRLQKELEFKVKFAEERVRDYCVRRFSEEYVARGTRPPSVEYLGTHSKFTFIQTNRIHLTQQKIESLEGIGIPIGDHMELKGLKVNFEAIREHRLEDALRAALQDMGIPDDVLEECFTPEIRAKESFFDHINEIVRASLAPGEDHASKLQEVLRIAMPVTQLRNPEVPGLSSQECLQLVTDLEIVADENLDAA